MAGLEPDYPTTLLQMQFALGMHTALGHFGAETNYSYRYYVSFTLYLDDVRIYSS